MKRSTKILRALQIFVVLTIGSMIACKVMQPKIITVPTDKVVVTEKYRDTTITLPPNTYYIKDSTVCPPSKGDTVIYKNYEYPVEGKTVIVRVPYYDTLRITNDTSYVSRIVERYEKSLAEQKMQFDGYTKVMQYGIWLIALLSIIGVVVFGYVKLKP